MSPPTAQEKGKAPERRLPDQGEQQSAQQKEPSIRWGRALNNKLLDAIEEHDNLRRTIWPVTNDKPTGINKKRAFEQLALILFSEPPYNLTSTDRKRQNHYVCSVQNKIRYIERNYRAAREEIGTTGCGVPSKEMIGPSTPLASKFDVVKKTCPDFFRLKRILQERTNVAEGCITNSTTSLNIPNPRMTAESRVEEGEPFDSIVVDDEEDNELCESQDDAPEIPKMRRGAKRKTRAEGPADDVVAMMCETMIRALV